MRPIIGVIAYPKTRSSYVMAEWEKAGFRLGDVDRRIEERYPQGRLELWTLAKWTQGRTKSKPLTDGWPELSLDGIDVVKALPAWIPVLEAAGVNYWTVVCRGGSVCQAAEFPHQEVINSNLPVDCLGIWQRAMQHITPRKRARRAKG